MRTILICGSRGWADGRPIGRMLDDRLAEGPVTVIHGGARGADALAGQEAARRGVPVMVVPAEWGLHGKAAGVIRNQKMLDEHSVDEVHAFRSEGKSSGTDDMLRRARRAGISTFLHTVKYEEKTLP